jgi:hypothetical protein
MPKYIVQYTPIIHGKKNEKESTRYEIGAEIELSAQEAGRLGDNVLPALIKVSKAVENPPDPPPDPPPDGADTAATDNTGDTAPL